MSNYDDLYKMQKRIAEMYKPVLEAVDIRGLMTASEALVKPMENIAALRYPAALQDALTNFANAVRAASDIDYDGLTKASRSIQAMFEGIQPGIELMKLNIPPMLQDYSDMVTRLNEAGYRFSDLVEQAYDSLEDEEEEDDEIATKEEIVELIEEQINNPIGFQEKLANKSEKFVKKYWIVFLIIHFLWANFCQPYFQDTIGKPVMAYTVSKVKELPEKAGKVIDELKHEVQAIITEDVPYYYKITYVDENGNIKEGYTAKKNIQIIEDVEETEVESAAEE